MQSSHKLTTWLFLRLLGVIFCIAFVSLGTQILGLAGSQGILPTPEFLKGVEEFYGAKRFWVLPTLCWLNGSDAFLLFLCWCGAALSILLIADIFPRMMLCLLWSFYLSLSGVCQEFLGFQWDILLLETAFLAIFLAPGHVLPKKPLPEPSIELIWLLRWLVFRLMFESGFVKLASGDETWRNLTALTYHYTTQPLPNILSWYVYQWPAFIHKLSVLIMLVFELMVPFFIFFGRWGRRMACGGFVILQCFILLTGNYCFFNYLTIILCLSLIDDEDVRRIFPQKVNADLNSEEGHRRQNPFYLWGTRVFAAVMVVLSVGQFGAQNFRGHFLPQPLRVVQGLIEPFRSINGYGLFAVMTTKRPEIIIEGSRDGKTWLPYEFKWKPGRLDRAPGWVAPHQPRLDWQMWFAALSSYQYNKWLIRFVYQLLKGSAPVLGLLDKNPFPDRPPQYIRALLYDYKFTDFETKKNTGQWWQREYEAPYCPPLSLKE